MLFPHVDLNNQFHIDHVFPISRFTSSKLTKAGFSNDDQEEMQDWANTMANLQLLEGQLNKEKNATLPKAWLKENFEKKKVRANYCALHSLGEVPDDLEGFMDFAKSRYEQLFESLSSELGSTASG